MTRHPFLLHVVLTRTAGLTVLLSVSLLETESATEVQRMDGPTQPIAQMKKRNLGTVAGTCSDTSHVEALVRNTLGYHAYFGEQLLAQWCGARSVASLVVLPSSEPHKSSVTLDPTVNE